MPRLRLANWPMNTSFTSGTRIIPTGPRIRRIRLRELIGSRRHLAIGWRRQLTTIPMIDDVHDALLQLRLIQEAIQRLKSEGRKKHTRMAADGRVFNISENR